MATTGILYLIPTPLGNIDPAPWLPRTVGEAVASISVFVVEKPKTAARFLGRMGIGDRLADCAFVPTSRLEDRDTVAELLSDLSHGRNIGVISEAGCPGVADPGAKIVEAAHSRDLPVVPLVGPSSVVLALMASGLNGQEFAFHGYLPPERSKRIAALRRLDANAAATRCTQIFIEAPHRNDHLLEDILATCGRDTMLCVAVDMTLPSQYIKTKSVADWSRTPPTIGKHPAIFLINRPSGWVSKRSRRRKGSP